MSEPSLLDQLGNMTVIVADTGDLTAISRLNPVDATTNPSLITKALVDTTKSEQIQSALVDASDIDSAIDELTIELGCDILSVIEGRVSTEVDARLSYDTEQTFAKAHEYINAYQKKNIDPNRVLIKIAATWEGIQAARRLEQEGIHCNLTLLFDMHQAKACADVGVTLISPFVGRIHDWQKRQEGLSTVTPEQDQGVQSVKTIYQYYKQHGYPTQVMGASFRNIGQICALAGCDLLTIAPTLLDELAQTKGNLDRQLSPEMDFETISKQVLDAATFNEQMQASQVTQDLLPAGIEQFVQARVQLNQMLQQQG